MKEKAMGILDQAMREIALEKQAAEDDARQALEDFDIITSRAIDAVKSTVAGLIEELVAAGWWTDELREESGKPEYLNLSFRVRRHAKNPDPATNPDYFYSIQFDALGAAVRTTDVIDAIDSSLEPRIEPLMEPSVFRGVARQDFRMDLEKDLKLFLKAILCKH